MIIHGTFQIDHFRDQSSGYIYLLTHHHSDHLVGLHKNFPYKVYCSKHTARLLSVTHPKVRTISFGVINDWFYFPQIDKRILVVSANHLRGSLSFYFPDPDNSVFYSGDYRPNQAILTTLKNNRVHHNLGTAYLDATFQDQSLDWPTHEESLHLFNMFCSHFDKQNQTVHIGIHHPGSLLLVILAKKTFRIHESVPGTLHKKLTLHYPEFIDDSSSICVVKPTKLEGVELDGPVLVPCTLYFACEGRFADARKITKDERGHYRLAFALHANFKENLFIAKTLRPSNLQFIHQKKVNLKCGKMLTTAK